MGEGTDESMELWRERVNQDITDMKNGYNRLDTNQLKIKDDIRDLQTSDKLQEMEIATLKATLVEIKGDTRYIREKMDGDKDAELDRHKNFWWKIVGALVIAALLFYFGIESVNQLTK
jgi:hypothetical protein